MKNMILNKKNIVLFFVIFICFFPYLKPADYCLNSSFITLFKYWLHFTQLISIFIIIKTSKISKSTILYILFQGSILFSTVLNSNYGDLSSSIYLFINNCSFFILFDYFLKRYNYKTVKYLLWIYGTLQIINIITMFLYYPNGMYIDALNDSNYYFLEHDNGSFFFALPIILLSFIYSYNKHGKISFLTYCFLFINIIGYLYVWSTMAFCCLMLIFLVALFANNKFINKMITSKKIWILLICFVVGIVFFNIQDYFSILVKNVFNKDLTLSGRTLIWQKAIGYIKDKILFGYGQEMSNVRMMRFGISHVHNIFLQLLYNGGIVSLFIYILLYLKMFKSIKKNSNKHILLILNLFLIIYFIASIFDFYNTKFIINILFICCLNANLFKEKEV